MRNLFHRQNDLGINRAPMDFFETTPLGRILSRFSKDVDVLDNVLPMHLTDFIVCSIEVTTKRRISKQSYAQ